MNRRELQTSLLIAAAACGASVVPFGGASADISLNQAVQQGYRYRLRYSRKQNAYSFWIRLRDSTKLDSDVPFRLNLSTDARGANLLTSRATIARAADSHIVRMQVLNLSQAGWTPGAPIYAQLQVGSSDYTSKVWKLFKS